MEMGIRIRRVLAWGCHRKSDWQSKLLKFTASSRARILSETLETSAPFGALDNPERRLPTGPWIDSEDSY